MNSSLFALQSCKASHGVRRKQGVTVQRAESWLSEASTESRPTVASVSCGSLVGSPALLPFPWR